MIWLLSFRSRRSGAGWLVAKHVARWEADAELEALWSSVTRVRDLVLERANMPSSLVALLSLVVELLDVRMDVIAANGVC
jgi:hypothetical protein